MLTISAGHYGKGTGASGFIDEGQEVIFVVQELEKRLKKSAVKTNVIMDRQSKNQHQNLTYLVQQHNSTQRELDVSVHFNSSGETRHDGIGTEVLYVNSKIHPFAQKLSATIAQAGGFKNRGAKQRTDLALLNGTTKPAIIIEICFVNSEKDVQHYKAYQSKIFDAIVAEFIKFLMPTPTPTSMLVSSAALQQKTDAIFSNKEYVKKQLHQGVEQGLYQVIWLEKFERGELTFIDYLAITTLQFRENFH